MGIIHSLPPELIAHIAAGEVIERPSFAVKELLENSIDAQATRIDIFIENGGLELISINDNGLGMIKEDVLESYKPHTTSKISQIYDLQNIHTLGFRGEALASIASVSKLQIESRHHTQKIGMSIQISHGEIKASFPMGMGIGTRISISNLFETLPARKKFLQNSQAEFRRILDVCIQIAISHPEISFKLVHNKKVIFDIPSQELESRIEELLGSQIYTSLLPVHFEDSYIHIDGFIGKPQIASTAQKQYLFINSRSISDKLISNAIKETFGILLEPQSIPFTALFFKLPKELVDINVHPRKTEIDFADKKLLYESVEKSIGQTLANHNLTFANMSWHTKNDTAKSQRKGSLKLEAAQSLRQEVKPWDMKISLPLAHSPILQVHALYLIMETKNGILCIDQHAAHERILYNQFKKFLEEKNETAKTFSYSPALLIDLPVIEMNEIELHIPFLSNLGFDLEVFDAHSIRINAVPILYKDQNIQNILSEIIQNEIENKKTKSVDQMTHRILSTLACKAAIKAGDTLTPHEREKLVEKLLDEDMAYTCPHGRPTRIEIPLQEFHKMFKRV